MSSDGLIIEYIDLSHIHLAVTEAINTPKDICFCGVSFDLSAFGY